MDGAGSEDPHAPRVFKKVMLVFMDASLLNDSFFFYQEVGPFIYENHFSFNKSSIWGVYMTRGFWCGLGDGMSGAQPEGWPGLRMDGTD